MSNEQLIQRMREAKDALRVTEVRINPIANTRVLDTYSLALRFMEKMLGEPSLKILEIGLCSSEYGENLAKEDYSYDGQISAMEGSLKAMLQQALKELETE